MDVIHDKVLNIHECEQNLLIWEANAQIVYTHNKSHKHITESNLSFIISGRDTIHIAITCADPFEVTFHINLGFSNKVTNKMKCDIKSNCEGT